MKKIIAALAAALVAVFSCGAAFADAEWDAFVAEMESRMKIKEEGEAAYTRIALLAPAGSDAELFELSMNAPSVDTRAAAGAALVKKWFPDGDPANWEQIDGFTSPGSFVPRQIVAVNALYNAVTALSELPDGNYAAEYSPEIFLYLYVEPGDENLNYIALTFSVDTEASLKSADGESQYESLCRQLVFALEEGATNDTASELLTKLGLFGPVLDGVQRAERSGKFTYMTRYCESNIMLLIVPAL